MKNTFKLTTSKLSNEDIYSKINNSNNEIIDLSEMNLFEAVKTIMIISTYGIKKNNKNKIKYKVTPNVQKFLSEIPISNSVELIF